MVSICIFQCLFCTFSSRLDVIFLSDLPEG
jgi:2-iminoacetate synthase ThiH